MNQKCNKNTIFKAEQLIAVSIIALWLIVLGAPKYLTPVSDNSDTFFSNNNQIQQDKKTDYSSKSISEKKEELKTIIAKSNIESSPWIIRERKLQSHELNLSNKDFSFSPFPEKSLIVSPTSYSLNSNSNSTTVSGEILGDKGEVLGDATVVQIDEDGIWLSARFALNTGELFTITHNEEGEAIVQEINSEHYPGCDADGSHSHNSNSSTNKFNYNFPKILADELDSESEIDLSESEGEIDETTIDILVVYTPATRLSIGSAAAVQALAESSAAATNTAYANSGINVRLNIVHVEEINYYESGNFSTDLRRIVEKEDGYMDSVHTLRDEHGADIVSLFVDNSSYCGVAYLMSSQQPTFEEFSFNVNYHKCALGSLSLAHEVSHNMGANHDPDNANRGVFTDSLGHKFGQYRTIMAYAPGIRVSYFSNPDISYNGLPTGLENVSDNAKALNSTRETIANFRNSTYLKVSGRVTDSLGAPVNRVIVDGGSLGLKTTNINGDYLFTATAGSSYNISVSKEFYTFAPNNYSGTITDDVTHDFIGTFSDTRRFTISGKTLDGSTPISGVRVDGGELGVKHSDQNGNYSFTNILSRTSYTISASKAGKNISPNSVSSTLTTNRILNFQISDKQYSITGLVTIDDSPVPFVSVNGGPLGTTSTGVNGQFSFPIKYGSSYSIALEREGLSFQPSIISGQLFSNIIVNIEAELETTSSSFDSSEIVDTDGDGISDLQEILIGTNLTDDDSDNDNVVDGQEILDGSNPLDRGSVVNNSPDHACTEWNGFLGGMSNVYEHINVGSSSIVVSSTLYSETGDSSDSTKFILDSGNQQDIAVHMMEGREEDSIGLVCSSHNGAEGDLKSQMVYYKHKDTNRDEIEFAFALPAKSPKTGEQFLTYNTYQPSLNPTDQSNFVANWVQILNFNTSIQGGNLFFYDTYGNLIGNQPVVLSPGARSDYSAHKFGQRKVGLVRWIPNNPDAGFNLRLVRYMYDNVYMASSFDTAFHLEGMVGSGELLTVPLDLRDSTAVIELANTLNKPIVVDVDIYKQNGMDHSSLKVTLGPYSSYHMITDDILENTQGIAKIRSNAPESLIATTFQYGRDASHGLNYMYGVQAEEALSGLINGSYNTYLNQGCNVLLINSSNKIQSAQIQMTRFDGTVIFGGKNLKEVLIPANGLADFNLCSNEVKNKYGVVSVQVDSPGAVRGIILRKGNQDQYRFPTPLSR